MSSPKSRLVLVSLIAAALAAPLMLPAVAGATTTCQPNSGLKLDHRKLTSEQISVQANLTCARLQGSDLTGVDLTQVDLSGADLTGADLHGTTLSQATLRSATLKGANLAGADLGQVDASGADFTNADLHGAKLIQATLTNAHLDGANVSGADFTQATLTGATFNGAQGVKPWSLYLLAGALVILVLLAARAVRRAQRSPESGPAKLRNGLLGALLVALGLHLAVGGMLGEFSFGFDTLAQTVCSGPQCALGLNSGVLGIIGGILATIVGAGLSAAG